MKNLKTVTAGLLALGAIGSVQAAGIPCTRALLTGNYAGIESGTIAGVGQVAGVGRLSVDGRGGGTATQTLNIAGGSVSRLTATLNYTMQPDCTGTFTFYASNGAVLHSDFVVTRDGNTINFVSTDPGSVFSGVDTRF